MDKWPQRLAKNKSDLMPKNASCKRWDTLHCSAQSWEEWGSFPLAFREHRAAAGYAKAATATGRWLASSSRCRLMRSISCKVCAVR